MICRNSVLILANKLPRLLRAVIAASMEKTTRHHYAIGILFACLTIAGSAHLSAQNSAPGPWQTVLIPDGETVYDTVNHVTWLAEFNLPATERYGFPLCEGSDTDPEVCIFASGAMNYKSARAWISVLNDNNYLGHGDWQLPSAPPHDPGCPVKGPSGDNFGFGCDTGALGYLYYKPLGLKAPNTAVPIPPNKVGPFQNFQPNLYWSDSPGGGLPCNIANFSFASGAQGGGCGGDFADVLPMIKGEVLGAPIVVGTKLQVNPDGKTVYDPETNVTWLADANLAANWLADTDLGEFDTLGLPLCTTAPDTSPCVAQDGSMDYASAKQFIINMNAYHGGKGYLGQTNWELPPVPADRPLYNCSRKDNPLGELFYKQLGKVAGEPVVAVPDIAVGPFQDIQPFPYWSCLADTIQDFCDTIAYEPATDSEWGFSFGTGFQGTERLTADHHVTVYFQGCDLSSCQTITFPPIKGMEDALTPLTLSATASSGLGVRFKSTTTTTCTVSGNTASLLFPGKCTIEASQPGDESWESALPIQRTFTVSQAMQTVTFPPIPNQKSGATVNLHATASSGLPIAFSASSSPDTSLAIGPAPVCEIWGTTAVMIRTGICTIEAYQAGDDLYAPAFLERSFTVEP